jgi:hypothetical protein
MRQSLGYIAYRALTCPVRLMPDFLIIGAHRGGTSSFYYYLTEHPSVAAATTKELNFFDRNFSKGTGWYRAHFPSLIQKGYMQSIQHQRLITGEASPHYLFYPLAAQRAAKTVPHIKLIVLLRNPVDRAYSHYRRYAQLGYETRSFAEAIAADEQRCDDGELDHYSYLSLSYLSRGLYADQLARWMRLFPREHLLILKSEAFYADPATRLKQALAFLQLPASGLPVRDSYQHFDGYIGHPERHIASEMDPALRQRLSAYFAPHNARLATLLGKDMGWDD